MRTRRKPNPERTRRHPYRGPIEIPHTVAGVDVVIRIDGTTLGVRIKRGKSLTSVFPLEQLCAREIAIREELRRAEIGPRANELRHPHPIHRSNGQLEIPPASGTAGR